MAAAITKQSSKQKDKLPPLPRTPHQQQQPPLQLPSSSSENSSSNLPIDFDRSLNIRRSKRFVRQPAQHHLLAPPCLQTDMPSSPATSSQPPSLHKAISTPSILDKLKSTSPNECDENRSHVEIVVDDRQSSVVSSSVSLNTAAVEAKKTGN